MQPHYSHSSHENAIPSSGTSPLASRKGVPPRGGLGRLPLKSPAQHQNIAGNYHIHGQRNYKPRSLGLLWSRNFNPRKPKRLKYLFSRNKKLQALRWLDWIFWGWYLPSLSINYVGMRKDMDKRLPQLYYINMKISYDLGFIAIVVAMAT